jgi:hypothetical protein
MKAGTIIFLNCLLKGLLGLFQSFFQKLAEIFASQGAPSVSTTPVANTPPVSMTLAANFTTNFASVVHTDGKFVTGGNLPLVSTTPQQICHWCQ